MDEDLIYHNGVAVGCWDGNHIVWFTSSTGEAIEKLEDEEFCIPQYMNA